MKKQIILFTLTFIAVLVSVSACSAASTIYVNNVTGNDLWDGTNETPQGGNVGPKATIQNGTDTVDNLGTVYVADGTYKEHITIKKNLTLVGQSKTGTVIDGTNNGRPLTITSGLTVNLSNISIVNGKVTDYDAEGGGIHNSGTLTMTNCNLEKNTVFSDWSKYWSLGGGLCNEGTAHIIGCNIMNNIANSTGLPTGGGGIINFSHGSLTANFNRIFNNTPNSIATFWGGTIYNIEDNWWGSNDPAFGNLLAKVTPPTNWLYMTINATPSTINNRETSLITASFNNRCNGTTVTPYIPGVGEYIPDGTPVIFSLTNGPFGTLTAPYALTTINGIASILFTANTMGIQTVNATADDQNVTATINILPAADLFIIITPSKTKLTVGETMVLRVKVGNNGPDSAQNVIVTYKIPDGMEYVGFNHETGYPEPTYDPTTRTVTWNLGNLGIIDPWMDITLKGVTAGSTSSEASVSSDTYDQFPENSIETLNITIEAAKVNAATEETVSMQQTGLPIVGLIIAVLVLFGGLVSSKRK